MSTDFEQSVESVWKGENANSQLSFLVPYFDYFHCIVERKGGSSNSAFNVKVVTAFHR